MIIFRKSTNKNSFGLRGYWAHCNKTRTLWSFATNQDLQIGDNVEPTHYGLPRLERTHTATEHLKFISLLGATR